MKKSIFYTLMLLCCCWMMPSAHAGVFNVTGTVTFSEQELPIPEYQVFFNIPSLGVEESAVTADDGSYDQEFEFEDGVLVDIEVYAIDFCTGDVVTVVVTNEFDAETVDFNLCSIINPPPPTDVCEAFFQADPIDATGLAVQFIDLSFSSSPINTWSWDFGDGNTSDEPTPLHTYAEVGEYEVTLTIESDSCAASNTQLVVVDTIYGGCNCAAIYDPVCVDFFGIPIEFPNECEALCAGADPSMFVDCDSVGNCNCDPSYDPVCAITASGEIIQFSNACYAECEGINPDDFVECEDDPFGCSECFDDEFDPVCVADSLGNELFFPNLCWAECEGFTADDVVDCQDNPFECEECFDSEYDPVCVLDSLGNELHFPNLCWAECEGYTSDDIVDCEDYPPFDCEECFDDEYDPVCVVDSLGNELHYPSLCWAECEGFTIDDVVDCEDDPFDCFDCFDDEFEPVCVIDSMGNELNFPNLCWAECEGYTIDDVVDCNQGCICDDIFDPVCVIDPATGLFLFFVNPCEAECAGYGPDQYTDCDGGQPDCWVDIFYYVNGPNGLEVNFEAFSDNADIISYAWDFGDSNTSTEQTPTHVYAEEGIYDVTVSIVTADSCEASAEIHICIGGGGPVDAPDCQAFFFFEQDLDELHTFQFQDFSYGTGDLTYAWDFGDGNTSTEQNPLHTYAEDGFYNVVLTIESDSCSSSFEMLVFAADDSWYEQNCQAFFLPIMVEEDGVTNVVFLNLSSADAITYEWDFGNGDTSAEPFPVYTYTEEGNYDVTLTITTADGCTNSFTMTLDLGEFDFSGSPVFFTTTDAEEPAWVQSLTLFPNPTSDELHVQLDSKESTNYQLTILNATGQQLQSQSFERDGQSTIDLNVSQYPSGIYFLQVQADEGQQVLRFIKE